MPNFLGIDVGTTGCRALLIDELGNIKQSASREYPLHTPAPGWTEQNPEDWAKGVAESVAEIQQPFVGIGFAGQMHGSVFLDDSNQVIRPALLWNDQRTATQVNQIAERCGLETVYEETCNPPLTGFQAGKILWLRETEPQNFARLKHVLLPKDFIRLALTGELATDVSDASGTGLFNVPQRNWSQKLIETLDLSTAIFPKSHESAEPVGEWRGAVVVAGAGDQAASAVGTGAVSDDVVSLSLGTSGVVFSSQDDSKFDPQGRVHTFCHANGRWHSMGVMLSCGGAVRWARDLFGFVNYDEMSARASQVPNSEILFKPYLSGERTPHNDPDLRGSFHNLSLASSRAHVASSIFEGVSFGLLDGFDLIQQLRGLKCETLRVTGGGAKSDYWMQLLADMFGIPTHRLAVDEGPAYGAALLAGVGAGCWSSVPEACAATVRTTQCFEPDPQRHEHLTHKRAKWLNF